MMKNRPRITAAELRAKLEADPVFVARRNEQKRERAERMARVEEEQAELLAELRDAGLKIGRVPDLIAMSARYQQAIPILLRHLQMPYSDVTRETIARALAVPDARYAWPILVAEISQSANGKRRKSARRSARIHVRRKGRPGLRCCRDDNRGDNRGADPYR